MAKTIPVEIRVADLPQMQRFIAAVAAVAALLTECDLTEQMKAAADELRAALAELGVRDTRLPPDVSDEDRIRDAMTEAQNNPGRTITR